MRLRERNWLLGMAFLAVLTTGALYLPTWLNAYQTSQLRRLDLEGVEKHLQEHPDDLEARHRLGVLYSSHNRQLEATRELLQVLAADPTQDKVLNDLGVCYLLQERYYEALVAFQSALQLKPDDPRVLANLGRLHLATKMPFTAAQELESSVKLNPGDSNVWCDLAEAQQQTLNMNGAEDSYKVVLKRDPNNLTAIVGYGKALFALTRYAEAEAMLNRALAIDPKRHDALQTLGRMRLQQAHSQEELIAAKATLVEALKSDPSDVEVFYDLGKCALRLKQPPDALRFLTQALVIDPTHEGALYQVAKAYRANNKTQLAEQAEKAFRTLSLRNRDETRLEERIFRAPDDNQARAQLVSIYLRSGKGPLAALNTRELRQRDPNNPRLPEFDKKVARLLAQREQSQRSRMGQNGPL